MALPDGFSFTQDSTFNSALATAIAAQSVDGNGHYIGGITNPWPDVPGTTTFATAQLEKVAGCTLAAYGPPGDQRWSFRFMADADSWQSNGRRAEFEDGSYAWADGDTVTLEWRTMFKSGEWVNDSWDSWCMFAQVHSQDFGAWGIYSSAGKLHFGPPGEPDPDHNNVRDQPSLDVWHSFKWTIHFGVDGIGWSKVWMDGAVLWDFVGDTMQAGETYYPKYGCYIAHDNAYTQVVYSTPMLVTDGGSGDTGGSFSGGGGSTSLVVSTGGSGLSPLPWTGTGVPSTSAADFVCYPTSVPAGGSVVLWAYGSLMSAADMAVACAAGQVTLAGVPLSLRSSPSNTIFAFTVPSGIPAGDHSLDVVLGTGAVKSCPVRVADTTQGTKLFLRRLLSPSGVRTAPVSSHSTYAQGGGAFRSTGQGISACWLDFASAFQDSYSGGFETNSIHGQIFAGYVTDKSLETVAGSTQLIGMRLLPSVRWTVRWAYNLYRGYGPAPGSGNCDLLSFYVYRPSTSSVVGRIFDNTPGNSNRHASVDRAHPWGVVFAFQGQAVSGIQDGDVLVAEAISQAGLTDYDGNSSLYYDGASAPPVADGAATSSDALATIYTDADLFQFVTPPASVVLPEKPALIYRSYRSDDLTKPMVGPIRLELDSISMNRTGASFEAKAPTMSLNRTGETYSIERFKPLRGLL